MEFARLGEVRSLIPQHVPIMSLTATATKSTRKVVMKRLNMKHPMVISVTPDKPNVVYRVADKTTMEDIVTPVADRLKEDGTRADKIIVYCRYHREVADFYELFKKKLGRFFTSPPCFADLAKYRVVDMYTSITVESVKKQILESFCNPNGKLRVVVSTVAFGMGLDCPNVRKIIHWGPSADLEGYVQETGRGGRDGEPCSATIFQKSDQQHTAKPMMQYCLNNGNCHRYELFKDFDDFETLSKPTPGCNCCDICMRDCVCGHCSDVLSKFNL